MIKLSAGQGLMAPLTERLATVLPRLEPAASLLHGCLLSQWVI